MQKSGNSPNTPKKTYSPDQFCRVCQCNIAIVGRGKCNIFSAKSSATELARRLSIVLDAHIERENNVSSNVCYKCKREMEKYEGYMKALNVDLKALRERYRKSVEEQRNRPHTQVKRCLRVTPSSQAPTATKRRFSAEMSDSITVKPPLVRPLLPAPVNVLPEMSLLPNHDDLFVATTPGSVTEVCRFQYM